MSDYTILLIDYDPKSIEHIERLMHAAGHRVEIAKNGLAGLESFREIAPSLVLVEAMLPKKHGFEVCQEIKASPEGKTTPVVILTAVYRGRKYRSQAFHLYHCDEYLEKPIDDARLMEVVGGFLETSGTKRPAASETAAVADKGAPASETTAAAEKVVPAPETKVKTAAAPKSADGEKDAAPVATKDTQKHPSAGGPSELSEAANAQADESMAEFTEEDIMSTLDAIMPDDDSTKAASG
jgi:DNA-binding response OmpR family regulator